MQVIYSNGIKNTNNNLKKITLYIFVTLKARRRETERKGGKGNEKGSLLMPNARWGKKKKKKQLEHLCADMTC